LIAQWFNDLEAVARDCPPHTQRAVHCNDKARVMLTDGMTQAASRSMPSRQAGFAPEKHRAHLDDKGIDPRFEHRPKCIFEVLRTMHTHTAGISQELWLPVRFRAQHARSRHCLDPPSWQCGFGVWDYFLEKLQPLRR